jgi:hypothetical protein
MGGNVASGGSQRGHPSIAVGRMTSAVSLRQDGVVVSAWRAGDRIDHADTTGRSTSRPRRNDVVSSWSPCGSLLSTDLSRRRRSTRPPAARRRPPRTASGSRPPHTPGSSRRAAAMRRQRPQDGIGLGGEEACGLVDAALSSGIPDSHSRHRRAFQKPIHSCRVTRSNRAANRRQAPDRGRRRRNDRSDLHAPSIVTMDSTIRPHCHPLSD